MEVFRGGNIVVVGGGAYGLYGLVTATHNEAKMYGPDNPAFHMPGWFYSGSPYGRQIKELADRNNIFMSDVPVDFVPEYVPPP